VEKGGERGGYEREREREREKVINRRRALAPHKSVSKQGAMWSSTSVWTGRREIPHMIENKVMHATCIFRLDDRREPNKVVLCSKVEVERFAPV
jgi:hypothetical protein